MSSSVDRVEVFSQIQRRRRWSVDQKLAILAEAGQPGMSISYVARRHGIAPSLVFGWRRRMTEGGKEAVRADDEVVARAEVRELQKRHVEKLHSLPRPKNLGALQAAERTRHEGILANRAHVCRSSCVGREACRVRIESRERIRQENQVAVDFVFFNRYMDSPCVARA